MSIPRDIFFRLEWHEEIPSTSALLLSRAGSEDFHGTIFAAHHQTQGRGRRGRTWETGVGNLAFSIGFKVPVSEQLAMPYFPLCAGIAVYDAVAKVLTPEAARELSLKWPNDIAWRGKKLMGLLSQARTQGGFTYLSIGIGINVAWAPENLPAIALKDMPLQAAGCPTKEEILEAIVANMQRDFSRWGDFAFLRKEWEARAPYLGKKVFFGLLEEEDKMLNGIALGLDASGALRVRLPDGKEHLLSTEDMSLRF